MKKLTVRILASVISAIFVIAIVFLALSVSSDKKRGFDEAALNFESISVYTKSLCGFYEPESEEFLNALKSRLGTTPLGGKSYYKLSLVCNGKEIYSEFYPDIKPNFSTTDFSADVSSTIGVTLTLKASYGTIDSENVFKSAKISFFLILIGTILAISLLVLQTFLMNRSGENDSDFDIDNIPDESETENEDDGFYEEDDDGVELSHEEMAVFEEPAAVDNDYDDFDDESNEEKPVLEESDDFSDFESQLNEEIANAAALGQDLSLVMVQCKDYLNSKPIFDNAVLSIKDSNPAEKLTIFDYKNGFTLLLKSTNLDKALRVGEDLHSKVQQMLKDYGIVTSIATGISSRTERMIIGSRLIAEAEQACEHGFEDKDNSVVAFRVDPELYKKFLAEQGANG